MFRPLPMQRVTLQVLREDAPHAALVLAENGLFDPEPSHKLEEQLPEAPSEHYRELYRSARARLDKILACCGLLREEPLTRTRVVEERELEQVNERLGELWRELSEKEERLHRLQEERKSAEQLLGTLDKFSNLDLDLGLLQGQKRFLDIHIGTLPSANLQRLSEAAGLAGYFMKPFLESEETAYVVVAGPMGHQQEELNRLLEAAGFHPLTIPGEFRDHPEKVRSGLDERIRRNEDEVAALDRELQARAVRYRDELTYLEETLELAQPYAELTDALRGRGGLSLISGWVPTRELPRLRSLLEEALPHPFVLDAREPFPDERSRVPSFVRHSRLLRPFAELVKNYGVPRYGEVDPTVLFALTFTAMFGMMFGDVGHGLIFTAAGIYLLFTPLRRFTPCVVGAGLSSTLFGFLYGSVFGYEELIHPIWVAPLSDPMLMLTVALYWGVGFILLVTAITVINRISDGRWLDALLDGKGVTGGLLYLGGLALGQSWFSGEPVGWLHWAAVAVPLGVILGYSWRHQKAGLGEKILVVFMEGFETLLGYIANTLSFLRVAAFSLNHVALAIAVFTLAEMMGTMGHWITVVLGNVFIMVLEGAIVAIQVLRLEYYEGFSRFFGGEGREFCPLKLQTRKPGGKATGAG